MNAPDAPSPQRPDPIAATAGVWLARRDRGFTAAEQDAFLEWLQADPRHRAEVARLARTWSALDSLAAWQPADGAAPNPDLLAPAPARRRRVSKGTFAFAGLGVAAALALVAWRVSLPVLAPEVAATQPGVRVIPRPEPQALADGSVAEVNHGGRLEVAFVETERRVRLREGEVHFTVTRDPERPFVVEAGDVVVRAIGTAFSVRRERELVEVLVTEGRIQIEPATDAPVLVTGGERVRIAASRRPVVSAEKPEVIERALAWRTVRLEFEGLPLASVVTEFNLRNPLQLAIGDEAAGRVKVAGTFQADKPEAFARLLEAGFGIAVERRPAGAWVLRSAIAGGGSR